MVVYDRDIFVMMDKKGRIDVYEGITYTKERNLWILSIPKYLDQL